MVRDLHERDGDDGGIVGRVRRPEVFAVGPRRRPLVVGILNSITNSAEAIASLNVSSRVQSLSDERSGSGDLIVSLLHLATPRTPRILSVCPLRCTKRYRTKGRILQCWSCQVESPDGMSLCANLGDAITAHCPSSGSEHVPGEVVDLGALGEVVRMRAGTLESEDAASATTSIVR